MIYKDLIHTANKFYDLVFVDLEKTLNEETTNEFFDATNFIVTLKPNQTALFLVDVYMHEAYTIPQSGEFFASRTITLEHPWQQKAN